MEMLSYTFSKMAGILKNRKIISFIIFAILIIVSFTKTPFAFAQNQTQSESPGFSSDKKESGNDAGIDKKTIADKRNYQRIIPLSSPLYREIDRLYLLAGKSRPSLSRPWSADEAKKAFEVLPENILDSLSDSAALIKREIEFGNEKTGTKKMSSKISPEINIEAHIKANDDREEWEHGYEARPPLIQIPLEWWFFTGFYMDIEFSIREEYAFVHSTDNYSSISFIRNSRGIDWNFPFRAFASFGGEHWNFQAGKDKASWGVGTVSNQMISDYSDFYNMIKFSTYWSRFKFSIVYIGLEAWLTDKEKEYGENEKANGNKNGLGGDYEDFNESFKCFIAKRMEFKILDNLSFAISEASMFGNKYINISELNPFMIFHNLYTPAYSNVMMTLELDYTPFSGLNTYIQFGMDEFQFPGIEGKDSRPGAMGLICGFIFVKQAYDGFLTFNLEAAYTDPYLYNRWHPNTKFTNRRKLWSSDNYGYTSKPIGYKYGPDAIVIYKSVQYEKPDQYMAAIDAKYILMGEKNDLDKPGLYELGEYASNLWAPSGTVERNLLIGLHGKRQVTKTISMASDIYYININNYHNVSGKTINDFEFTASVGFKF